MTDPNLNPFLAGITVPEEAELDPDQKAALEQFLDPHAPKITEPFSVSKPLTPLTKAITAPAPWMYYSRWMACKSAGPNWIIMSSQYGHLAPEPNVFKPDDYESALRRSDALNAQERDLQLQREE